MMTQHHGHQQHSQPLLSQRITYCQVCIDLLLDSSCQSYTWKLRSYTSLAVVQSTSRLYAGLACLGPCYPSPESNPQPTEALLQLLLWHRAKSGAEEWARRICIEQGHIFMVVDPLQVSKLRRWHIDDDGSIAGL
jgi:hypothetical protein